MPSATRQPSIPAMWDSQTKLLATGTRLLGPDSYAVWNRSLQAVLAGKNLIEHISEDLSTIQSATLLSYPLSGGSTTSERQKRHAALYKDEQRQGTTFGIIYHSLSTNIQNRIPENKLKWLKPNPKELYEWLQQTYSANSPARQAKLWKAAWGTRGDEHEDPQAGLAAIQANLDVVTASAINNKVSLSSFIDKVTAYAMLACLPPSYDMLSSTLLANGTDITAQQVISAATLEYHRRVMQREEVNPHGLLVKKTFHKKPATSKRSERRPARIGHDGNPMLGRESDKYCEEHKRWGHNTTSCFRLNGKQPGHLSKAAIATQDIGPDHETFVALSSSVAHTMSQNKIIIDSTASDHGICNRALLGNLVTLPQPIRIRVGNGNSVSATHAGDLQVGCITYDHAYYVPDMVHNLLSVRRLSSDPDQQWTFTPTQAWLSNKAGKRLIEGELSNGVYVVRLNQTHITSC